MDQKILIIGLGNPGKKYAQTPHNAGFLAIDAVQKHIRAPEWQEKIKHKASVSIVNDETKTVILAKPLTYMNLSGTAVLSLQKAYGILPENIWCLYDDIDLPLGTIRLRTEGSPGTHNGMRSVTTALQTEKIPRIRIGIETGVKETERDLSDFVLKPFPKEEKTIFEKVCTKVIPEVIALALKENFETAMAKTPKVAVS